MVLIVNLISVLCSLYVWVIVIRAIISWFSPDPYNPLYRALISITEPILEPFRRVLPSFGGLDFSPIIVILIIEYIIKGIVLPFIASI
ncbi:MAG TPA: YggT family protein [Candidatus Cloacimonadota bacterium]|nr:YggT family protein [Candidatus Cloacimonadales bacterium]HPY97057.1 YggT family protein [Candidatus Cloacimonadota bacterium]HQB41613.1 YggT family protein [Candidatus Cloacimonadota bacterium]